MSAPAPAEIQPQNPGLLGAAGEAGPGNKKFSDVWNDIQLKNGTPTMRREFKKELQKDDFVKIMMSQLKNQDPTKPMDADKMAQELAQLGSMEQLQNINTALGKMSTANQPLEKLAMANLIGKSVVVDSSRFQLESGVPHSAGFPLAAPAESIKITVMNAHGQSVFTKDLGKKAAGPVQFEWDGKVEGGGKAEPGTYKLVVDARDARGQPIQVKLQREERVSGVSYEGKEPVVVVGSGSSLSRIPLSTVTGISDSAVMAPARALPLPASPQQEDARAAPFVPNPNSNFFTFEKGVGSRPLNQAETQVLANREPPEEPSAPEGFPNGLKGGEQ